MSTIYMDNAATTCISNKVIEAMLPYLKESYGNPSSLHSLGRKSRIAVEDSRNQVAECLNVDPEQIFFTSCATEANNWLLKSYRKVLTSPFEHKSVLNSVIDPVLCEVDKEGLVVLDDIEDILNNHKIELCSIMAVNNEIGTTQPINVIAQMCHDKGIPYHTDATQVIGYSIIDASKFDYLTFSGHKIHAPKGVGVLYAKTPNKLQILLNGGMQERGLRAGTENVANIVGLATALKLSQEQDHIKSRVLEDSRNYLQSKILSSIEGSHINCQRNLAPHILSVRIDGVRGADIVTMLDEKDICISAGSACNAGNPQPSHVLKAIGLTDEQALSSIRFSLSTDNTFEDIDYVVEELNKVVRRLRLYK